MGMDRGMPPTYPLALTYALIQMSPCPHHPLGIHEEDITGCNGVTKMKRKKTLSYFKEKITRIGNDKTKIQYFLEGRGGWKQGHIPEYMNKLTRNQASIIFQGRTRMFNVKINF